MKIAKKLNLFLLIIITAFSCDELDELTEFDITDDFSTSVNISVPDLGDGMAGTFSQTASLDISSNQEIQDNLNLIQNVSLNALTYEISNFNGAEGATITEASLSFNGTSVSVSDINLKQSDDANTVYEIADSALLNAVANALKNSPEIVVTLTGTVNATPVAFDVIIRLDATLTIDVL